MLVVTVDDDPDLLADRLWQYGATAVVETDRALQVAFALPEHEEAAAAALRASQVTVEFVADDHGAIDGWRAFAKVVEVAGFVIRPAWLAADRHATDHDGDLRGGHERTSITIEPGSCFGIGAHPTTRGCVEALAATAAVAGGVVVDIGTGTGVLAIVAARLGARRVLATDTDPAAIPVARANVRRNQAERQIIVHGNDADAEPLPRRWGGDTTVENVDVVVVNLGGLEAPTRVVGRVADRVDHAVIVGGLLGPDLGPPLDPLDAACAVHGFTPDRDWHEDGWITRRYRRAAR